MSIVASGGRQIKYLRVSVIDQCNLRCMYCIPLKRIPIVKLKEILTLEEIERVVRCAVENGVRKVRVTGGEPLIRPGLIEFIYRLRQIPSLNEITMTTNGILLADKARELAAAGLSRVNVSLDSLRPEVFTHITGRGDLSRVIEGIEAAERAGLVPIKINAVVMRGVNDDEIPELARLSQTRGWHVRFIEFMPVGCAAMRWKEWFVPASEILSRIAEVGELTPLPPEGGGGPARCYRLPGASASVGVISAMTEHFCDSCDRLRITADGKIRSCLLAGGEVDIKDLLRRGASDEEIRDALQRAAALKPEWHGFTASGEMTGKRGEDSAWSMSQIGG